MSRQENHAWIYRVCLRYEKTERYEIREKYNESDLNVSAVNWDCGVLYITARRYTPSDRCRSRENSIAFTVKRDSGVEVYNLSEGAMLAPRFSLVRGSHWPRNPSSCISTNYACTGTVNSFSNTECRIALRKFHQRVLLDFPSCRMAVAPHLVNQGQDYEQEKCYGQYVFLTQFQAAWSKRSYFR